MTPRLAQPAEQSLIQALIDVAAEQTNRRQQNTALLAVGAAMPLLVTALLGTSGVGGARGFVR